jgi:hypothetical protein
MRPARQLILAHCLGATLVACGSGERRDSGGGGDAAACQNAEQTAEDIRNAASEDGIAGSVDEICANARSGQLAIPPDRNEQYLTACAKYAEHQSYC